MAMGFWESQLGVCDLRMPGSWTESEQEEQLISVEIGFIVTPSRKAEQGHGPKEAQCQLS